jgi:glutamate synthase (NADH)
MRVGAVHPQSAYGVAERRQTPANRPSCHRGLPSFSGLRRSSALNRSRVLSWVPQGPGKQARICVLTRCGHSAIPPAKGLFNPENDKDSCGVGFVAELSKQPNRGVVVDALEVRGGLLAVHKRQLAGLPTAVLGEGA